MPEENRSISKEVRTRILHSIKDVIENGPLHGLTMRDVLVEMQGKLLRKYGSIHLPSNPQDYRSDDPVINHYFNCDAKHLLEFIELCFTTRGGFGKQKSVCVINDIFDEEGIEFEFSPYVEREELVESEQQNLGSFYGRMPSNSVVIQTETPRAMRRDEKRIHCEVVKPCLEVLTHDIFESANKELLDAFQEFKNGRYADAITDAGSAFESVLKILCREKGWAFDNDKDTCSRLLEICQSNGLFYPFFREILQGVGTTRNKIGDAHGKGPKASFPATRAYAEHMLFAVCNNINLVVTISGVVGRS